MSDRHVGVALLGFCGLLAYTIGQFLQAALAAQGWDAVGLWAVCGMLTGALGLLAWFFVWLTTQ